MADRQHVATAARAVHESTAVGLFAKRDPSGAGERLRAWEVRYRTRHLSAPRPRPAGAAGVGMAEEISE